MTGPTIDSELNAARAATTRRLMRLRRQLKSGIGGEALRALHEPSAAWDAAAILTSWGAAVGLVLALGRLQLGPAWIACVVAQGLVLSLIGLVNHDLFVHRRRGGAYWSWAASLLFTLPLPLSSVRYAHAHLVHHRYLQTAFDSESYKLDIDTRARKLLFTTLIGLAHCASGRWCRPRRRHYLSLSDGSDVDRRRASWELLVRGAWWVGVALSVGAWPRAVLGGYLLPALLVTPFLNALRILIEHAELDPTQEAQLATFYQTGAWSRFCCLWDSGDCHQVHHLFPTIPFYRVGRALELMRPHFRSCGLRPRTSYLAIVYAWFVRNERHGSSWALGSGDAPSAPSAATAPSASRETSP